MKGHTTPDVVLWTVTNVIAKTEPKVSFAAHAVLNYTFRPPN